MKTQQPSLQRRASMLALISALGCGAWSGALAQTTWPSRPIKFLVPAPAGGASDVVARTIAEGVRKSTGQAVVVDNKPGAGGAIAVEALLQAPRDGHTFVFSPNSLVTEVPHSIKLRYDVFKDIEPVAEVATVGLVLLSNPGLPIKNLNDMIAYVKAHPGKTSFASYSPGTLSHIKGLQFNKAAGTDMEHVGYKGSPPALQDVMGGQVQFMFDGMGTAANLVKAGKVRGLAVTSPARSPLIPDVPTLAELGYPELTQTMGMGFWSTPDVPADIRGRFRAELLKVLAMPAVREHFQSLGMETASTNRTAEDWSKTLRQEFERTGQALRAINYKP